MTDLEPGIYHDISFADYKSLPYLNNGTLRWMGVSPAHCKAALGGEMDTDSDARKFGRAVHVKLLEPASLWDSYLIAKPCNSPLASGKRKGQACGNDGKYLIDGEWKCGQHAPKGSEPPEDYVTTEEAERIEAMAKAVMRHKAVRLLRAHGGSEVTLVWDTKVVLSQGNETDGFVLSDVTIRQKARLDKYSALAGFGSFVTDLKKVGRHAIDTRSCEAAITNNGYYHQAGMYSAAVFELTGVWPRFIWTFMEDEPPHDVNVIQADAQTLQIGREEYLYNLRRFAECQRDDHWPGVSDDVTLGGLSAWKRKQGEQFSE